MKTVGRSTRCTAALTESNHGVVSVIEFNGDLIMIAKGPGRVLRLPIAPLDREFGA